MDHSGADIGMGHYFRPIAFVDQMCGPWVFGEEVPALFELELGYSGTKMNVGFVFFVVLEPCIVVYGFVQV